ncbi:hypothetical protein EXIGLDRAFT_752575 [Exidia glandulosa HHB12029]|uniref:Uncharacterized protein n=1 Tax=Exidia glandulosa HHB12029 TaxID=1314781 RepID=A0A165EG92_EXIGL|nr:hypothetical protein EXIGLDRAFT_752575 [Exidia glandulosa HHB12029]
MFPCHLPQSDHRQAFEPRTAYKTSADETVLHVQTITHTTRIMDAFSFILSIPDEMFSRAFESFVEPGSTVLSTSIEHSHDLRFYVSMHWPQNGHDFGSGITLVAYEGEQDIATVSLDVCDGYPGALMQLLLLQAVKTRRCLAVGAKIGHNSEEIFPVDWCSDEGKEEKRLACVMDSNVALIPHDTVL